jgi:gluconate 2-dehydrogenase gamma chain
MGSLWEISRRRFLKLAGIIGAAARSVRAEGHPPAPILAGEPKPRAELVTIAAQRYQSLDPHQVATLEAIAEQIIPADQDPGAKEAGSVRYIDRVLAAEQADRKPIYAAGLEGLDQTCQLLYDRDFVRLSSDEQTAVLAAVEKGEAPGEIWKTVSSPQFFELVWIHVLEGYYGPPEHGGNKDYASWKMVGFPEHSGTM